MTRVNSYFARSSATVISAASETINFFELYSDFLRSNPFLKHSELPISPTIESIFIKLPKLYEKPKQAISCYRKYLQKIDARFAPNVKAVLARDAAMLILQTSNSHNYQKIKVSLYRFIYYNKVFRCNPRARYSCLKQLNKNRFYFLLLQILFMNI